MTQADAAYDILRKHGPMHRDKLASLMLANRYPVRLTGRTPEESVGRAMTQEIANLGPKSRFAYLGGKGSGTFKAV